jgi:UDP-GlcNAc:undecaprenyl-phosphate GlcNAc-1-phosphate transferase
VKTALAAFFPSLVLSYLLTPLALRLATRFNVVDHPDERRVHDRPTPRWGGLAIYVAFVVAVVLVVLVHPRVGFDPPVVGVLLGGTVVAIFGFLDDKYDFSALIQIAAICAGGLVLIAYGSKIAYISNPFGHGITLHWLSIPVTLLWIFGVTKAVDLMDGLDGLAAGICAIASLTLLLMTFRSVDVAWAAQHTGLVRSFVTVRILSGALLGASLGFLRFNYPPAKIFMGTIGAQFMGFVISSAAVIGAFKVAALVAIAVPLLVLAVPILDAAFVVVMRAMGGRRVYEADKSHVHHRLLDRGLSLGQTIWVIYLLTAILSAVGLVLFWYVR